MQTHTIRRTLTAGVESVTRATNRNPLGGSICWQTDIMQFARRNQSRQYTRLISQVVCEEILLQTTVVQTFRCTEVQYNECLYNLWGDQ